MDKNIKIYSVDGKFIFTVNKFSSLHHSKFTKFASPSYRYAWEANRDARAIAQDHAYHIEALEKFAFEELESPVVEEVSAERQLADHYTEVYDGLADVADGMYEDDKLQKEMNYQEAKAVLKEILYIQDEVPEDEYTPEDEIIESDSRLKEIEEKVKKLIHKFYEDEVKKDKKKADEEEAEGNALPEGGMGMEDPMNPMGDPMGGDPMSGMEAPMGGGMPPPMASSNSLIKTAAREDLDEDCERELFEEYGCRACAAIEGKHKDAVYRLVDGGIEISDAKGKLLKIVVGDDLFVEDILPSNSLQDIYKYTSLEFYQAYWKPIVEKIGHCCVDGHNTILHLDDKVLPDIPKEFPFEGHQLKGVNKETKEVSPISVSFKGKNPSWFISPCSMQKSAGSAINTKEDYFQNGKGAIVVCTDPTLKSYYQNTGHVLQVVPFDSHIEVDVNFGNHIFRMTENQFDIIDGL